MQIGARRDVLPAEARARAGAGSKPPVRGRAVGVLTGWLVLAVAGGAAAHDEAKPVISPRILLDQPAPDAASRDRAFDQAVRQGGPAPARPPLEGEVQPDGSVRYGNTRVFIRHLDCPPGSEFYEPPPLPGRRRR